MHATHGSDSAYQQRFFQLALAKGNLRFGEFTLKSGRRSPYFFNAGGFADGDSLAALGECYADAILAAGLDFDMLFGPAYKGIPLVAAVAIAFSTRHGRNLSFAYNRKEAKDHGEGGQLVGTPLAGRVLIIDDVISAGTSVRESMHWIRSAGAQVAGVAIALDREERGQGELSAAAEVMRDYAVPVIAVAGFTALVAWLELHPEVPVDITAMQRYRAAYGC